MSGSTRLTVIAALATVGTSVALGPAYLRATWFLPTVAAVVVVALGAELARRYTSSRATAPVAGLLALFAFLVLRYAQEHAWLGVLPSREAVEALGALARGGLDDVERYAAPIGVSPGVEFITVAGVGLVAVAVDTLAVTLRRASLAGLPLLAVYTVPVGVLTDGVNWLAFAAGAAGYLALLLAESRERISRWGRPMRAHRERPGWTPQVDAAPLTQVGRRVGATALGLAIVVPAVVPSIDAGAFGTGGFGSGGGGSKVAVLNPIVDLGQSLRRPDNRPVIVYRGPPTYLRMVGLDDFTGDQWRPSPVEVSRDENNVEDGLGPPPGLGAGVPTERRRYDIEILDLKNTWLPLPYPARRVTDIEGTWLYDPQTFNVFGENTSTLRLSYTVTALDVQPTAQQLRAAQRPPASMKKYLRLPKGLDPRIEVQARNVAGGLGTAYDRALALQEWLRDPENFTYDINVGGTVGDGNGSAAILRFLDERRGYCVQFASTMAVMARMFDIPARVAVGFTSGIPDRAGRRIVSLHDAHSWPELYFQGVGWVAFEPTPAVRTGEPPSYAQPDAAAGGGAQPGATPTPTSTAAPNPGSADAEERRRQDLLDELAGQGGGGGGIGAGPVRIPVAPLVTGLGVLVLLAVPALVRVLVRRRRWARVTSPAARARAGWADLQDTLLDYGYRWRASDTPRAGVDRLVRDRKLPAAAAAAAERLATATERARYAPVMGEAGDLRADVATVRAGLAGTAGRWTRLRARLLPRSTRAVTTALGERLADLLDGIDAAFDAVGTRLTGRPSR